MPLAFRRRVFSHRRNIEKSIESLVVAVVVVAGLVGLAYGYDGWMDG